MGRSCRSRIKALFSRCRQIVAFNADKGLILKISSKVSHTFTEVSQEPDYQDMATSSKFNQMTSFEVNRDRHLAENRGTLQRHRGLVTTDFGWIDSGVESVKSEKDYVVNRGRFHRGKPSTGNSTAIASEYPRFADFTSHIFDAPSICEGLSTTLGSEIVAIVEPNGKTTKLRIITDADEDPYEECAEKVLSKLELDVKIKPKVVNAIKEAVLKLLLTLPRAEAIRGDHITKDDEGGAKEKREKAVDEKFEDNFYEVPSESTPNGECAVLENHSDHKKACPFTGKRDFGGQQRRNKLDVKPVPRTSNVSELAIVGSSESMADVFARFPAAKQTRINSLPMCCVFVPRSPSPENNGAADYQGKAFPIGKQSAKRYHGERSGQEDCSQISTFYRRSSGETEIRNSKRVVKRDSVLWTQSSVVQVLGVF